MDSKQKLKNVEFPEPVIFWKWANLAKLAVVTATAVFMMDINNPNEDQVKIMDRAGPIADASVQIIGFGLEPNQKWCALWGIMTPDGGKTINGHIQLFLIEGAKQQLLEGIIIKCKREGKVVVFFYYRTLLLLWRSIDSHRHPQIYVILLCGKEGWRVEQSSAYDRNK
jgi:hypothetical protein